MEPGIGRSIVEGFRAANRSWAAIGFFASVLGAITLFLIVGIALSLPSDLLDEAGRERGAIPLATVNSAERASEDKPSTLFQELEVAKEPQLSLEPPASAGASAEDDRQAQRRMIEERRQHLRAWLLKTWPLLSVCALLFLAANVWLVGGQISYVALHVMGGMPSLSDFLQGGLRAFGSLCGAMGLVLLLIGATVGVIMAVVIEGPRLLQTVPAEARRLLAVLIIGTCAAGLFWYAIRLSFWGIAIVRDHLGPIAGLKASFAATRGRWWATLGLGLLAGCIFYGVRLPFGVIKVFGTLIGGVAALAIWALCTLLSFVVNLYVSFAVTGAYVRFSEDTKPVIAHVPVAS